MQWYYCNKKMKKLFLLIFVCVNTYAFAQNIPVLNKVLELGMPEGLGTRGASVAYHPIQKKYYAAFAGNPVFPLAVFDEKGKRLSADSLKTNFDVRSLWYDPQLQTILGNGYDETGWFKYKLNPKGIPVGGSVLFEGKNQPFENSVGAYDTKKKQVYFIDDLFDDSCLIVYNAQTGKQIKNAPLKVFDNDLFLNGDINYNLNIVFTGQPKAEIGLFDYSSREIHLYDINTGKLSKKLSLPETSPKEEAFNFAYANGIFWLFDIENRKWIGYK